MLRKGKVTADLEFIKMPDKERFSGAQPALVRRLGLFDSTMILMGIVIGSGIFMTTGLMAESIPNAGLILLAWFAGGLLTLAGALTYAELGAAFPEAGGQYIYLREAYGPLPGFLFGWLSFTVYITGGIAVLALAFAEYYGFFFPSLSTEEVLFSVPVRLFSLDFVYSLSTGQLVAVAAILLLSLINYAGLGLGKAVQNILTVTKIGVLAVIIFIGLAFGGSVHVDLMRTTGGTSQLGLLSGFGLALVLVIWAFDGWNNVTFVAGEVRNPGRNIPRALFLGTLFITALYLLTNVVYLLALPIEEMSGIVRIAEKAATALFGGPGAAALSAAVLVSIFGSLNGSILVGPRIYYAMARDGLFFKRVSRVHPRFKTPGFSIMIQAVWGSVLVLSGTIKQIVTFAMFVNIMFWIAATASVFTLRKKYPDKPRPYKTWGYPVVPVVFIIASAGILLNTLFEQPVESLAGVGLTIVGVPIYYFWKSKSDRAGSPARGGES
jgi:APA family basic amino acid/polyamine antiporter